MIVTSKAVINKVVKFDIFIIIPIGKRIATSTSKIRKIKVVMKNRSEKALRAFLNGEKPHSNGDIFSCSFSDFSLIKKFNKYIIIGIIIAIIINGVSINIKILTNK